MYTIKQHHIHITYIIIYGFTELDNCYYLQTLDSDMYKTLNYACILYDKIML